MHERKHLPLWRLSKHCGRSQVSERESLSMIPFQYSKATTANDAMQKSAQPHSALLAGGTTLVDLMKLDVMTPTRLVDINNLPLAKIENLKDGVRIGAMVRNSD